MTETGDPCAHWTVLMHAAIDGALDAANLLAFEAHLESCPACRAEYDEMRRVHRLIAEADARLPAAPALHDRVRAALAREGYGPAASATGLSRWRRFFAAPGRWTMVPSLAVLAAALVLFLMPPGPSDGLEGELVAGHVRSLLVDHLTDVATSDRHTVKPWFNGKIDFSPPVVDLQARGFPLVGGRVDYVGGRVVAALVYRRDRHLINLFVWPQAATSRRAAERDGYNLFQWTAAGLTFWAVSDLNPVELKEFAEDLADAAPQ